MTIVIKYIYAFLQQLPGSNINVCTVRSRRQMRTPSSPSDDRQGTDDKTPYETSTSCRTPASKPTSNKPLLQKNKRQSPRLGKRRKCEEPHTENVRNTCQEQADTSRTGSNILQDLQNNQSKGPIMPTAQKVRHNNRSRELRSVQNNRSARPLICL